MKCMIDRCCRSTRLLRLALVALVVACVAQVAAAKASLTAHRNGDEPLDAANLSVKYVPCA